MEMRTIHSLLRYDAVLERGAKEPLFHVVTRMIDRELKV